MSIRKSEIEFSTELLRTLHRIHRQRTDLKGQIDRGPRQVKAGETMVTKATTALETIKEKNKQATLASDEKTVATQVA